MEPGGIQYLLSVVSRKLPMGESVGKGQSEHQLARQPAGNRRESGLDKSHVFQISSAEKAAMLNWGLILH